MSKEKVNNEELEEKRQKIISTMKALRDKREAEIFESELDVSIIDIQYLGAINWLDERDGGDSEKQKDIFVIIEERKGEVLYRYYDENLEMLAVQMQSRDEILPSEKYTFKKDKDFLKDIENLEEKESLKKVEEEERASEEETEKDEVRQKPKYLIKSVNLDRARYNGKSLRTILGDDVPPEAEELIFTYPSSTEDRKFSDDITVKFADKEGYVINLDVDKMKKIIRPDNSTGVNPTNDKSTEYRLNKTVKDNPNNTMMRFELGNDNNSNNSNPKFISLKQKDELGDDVDIFIGEKTHDENRSSEVELETETKPVQTDSELQKIMDGKKGIHDGDRRQEEFKQNGEEETSIDNADGNIDTHEINDLDYIPGTDITWQEFANKCGYRGEGSIEQAQKKFIEYQNNNTQVNNKDLIEMIEDDLNDQMGNGTIEKSLY